MARWRALHAALQAVGLSNPFGEIGLYGGELLSTADDGILLTETKNAYKSTPIMLTTVAYWAENVTSRASDVTYTAFYVTYCAKIVLE
ncbi:hypothetical protein [Paracoccus sp. ME4]|uniref:hypothetical protein n=1 Tax=Paracoccus sp. ME4 TaxID=3138066 RepID=UPI00398B0D66